MLSTTASSDELIGERGHDEELDGGVVFGHIRSGELRAQQAKGGKGRGDGAHRAAHERPVGERECGGKAESTVIDDG